MTSLKELGHKNETATIFKEVTPKEAKEKGWREDKIREAKYKIETEHLETEKKGLSEILSKT